MAATGTSTAESESSAWNFIQKKFRMRTFSEFMTPALAGKSTSVPAADGSVFAPTNAFNIAWVDYEIAPNTKLVYWQRFNVNFASQVAGQGVHAIARNPRFAFRRLNVFNSDSVTTTYDLYVQPGVAPEATSASANRSFEFGVRTNTSYAFPSSKWTIGLISETTGSLSSRGGAGADFYGWFMPWASYDFTKVFSTQHYVTLNYMHDRGTSWSQLQLDGMPYIQNGIGVNITEKIWAAAFLNNYLTTAPTLENSWASLWVSTSFL